MAKGPKMKTNRAAAKRFKRTASGRIKRNKAYHGHMFTRKSPKRLRNLRKSGMIASCDEGRVNKMLGGK
jgi:large subunit ribosomal protein L35